tara:strand:- start:648 stop:1880 length:1233 start_codon:yes stop_codon:yes gene_type:complete
MKIAYILYNERPMSGILRSQVLNVLNEIHQNHGNISIELICFWQPHILITHKKELKEMNLKCHMSGIVQKNYFICPPNRILDKHPLTFDILNKWVQLFLKKILKKGFDIVHSRAYYAGYFVSEIANKYKIKHIFDARSLFPDEMLASGIVNAEDTKYKMWKNIEEKIISSSDANIAVSEGMKRVIDNKYKLSNITYIPLCVDTKLSRDINSDKEKIRKNLGIKQSKIIGYCGSLSTNFNNNIYLYIKYMKFIISKCADTHFLIITQSDIIKIMNESNIQKENYSIFQARGKKLFELLGSCDAGIFVMDPGKDRETRLGIKFVEYLSAGIPVIANSNVGDATKIIKEKGFGVVMDLNDPVNDTEILRSFLLSFKIEENILKDFAFKNYDKKRVSRKYLELYEKVINKNVKK